MFNKGDHVRVIVDTSDVHEYTGDICRVDEDNSPVPWVITFDGEEWFSETRCY